MIDCFACAPKSKVFMDYCVTLYFTSPFWHFRYVYSSKSWPSFIQLKNIHAEMPNKSTEVLSLLHHQKKFQNPMFHQKPQVVHITPRSCYTASACSKVYVIDGHLLRLMFLWIRIQLVESLRLSWSTASILILLQLYPTLCTAPTINPHGENSSHIKQSTLTIWYWTWHRDLGHS